MRLLRVRMRQGRLEEKKTFRNCEKKYIQR